MIVIDFETKSNVDLVTKGAYNYTHDLSTEMLVLGYKVDDGPVHQVFPGDDIPECFKDTTHKVYAYNFAFDFDIWNNVCVRLYGWEPLSIERIECAQALCARYGMPQNLKDASRVLNTETVKDTFGKRLIQLFSCPPFADPRDYPDQWAMFLEYNANDVKSTYDVIKALPSDSLSAEEREIWLLNHKINYRGVPVAIDEAKQILNVTTIFLEEHNERLPQLTNGMVGKVTQIKRIKDWMASIGYPCESLAVDELQKWLQRDDLPPELTEVLEIRAGMGLSSLGKYKRMINEEHNGRVYYNSKYYGAHTGRITGSGLQLLNLPRASVANPEDEIGKFFDLSILYDNPVLSARALIRSMVKASPGNVILAADYSSIEYILLMYFSKDTDAVNKFATGLDQYKDLAATIYDTPYDEVTKEQRQMGKMGILGCGYGLGAQGFVQYADKWGVKLSFKDAKKTVDGFRSLYSKAVSFWYDANNCAITALEVPGKSFSTNGCTFTVVKDRNKKVWLQLTLPSGRSMYYYNPQIEVGKFGPNVSSWSINQTTRTWAKKHMTPGKWVENIIQALGRDLLYYGKMKIEEGGYPIIFSIYDEVVVEVPEGTKLEGFEKLMMSVPPWAKGLPLRAEGYASYRYRKG